MRDEGRGTKYWVRGARYEVRGVGRITRYEVG